MQDQTVYADYLRQISFLKMTAEIMGQRHYVLCDKFMWWGECFSGAGAGTAAVSSVGSKKN